MNYLCLVIFIGDFIFQIMKSPFTEEAQPQFTVYKNWGLLEIRDNGSSLTVGLITSKAEMFPICAEKCDDTEYCTAFEFDKGARSCKLQLHARVLITRKQSAIVYVKSMYPY